MRNHSPERHRIHAGRSAQDREDSKDEHHTGRHPVSTDDDGSLPVAGSQAQRRAVVFGGGGATGNAWALGVTAGLAEFGVALRQADRTIGTSSGATVAAQLTAASPCELYEAATAPPHTA